MKSETNWFAVIFWTVVTFGLYLVIKKNWRFIWPVLAVIYFFTAVTVKYEGSDHRSAPSVDRGQIEFTYAYDANGNVTGTFTNNSKVAIEEYTMTCTANGEETQVVFHNDILPGQTVSETVYSFEVGYGSSCSLTSWETFQV